MKKNRWICLAAACLLSVLLPFSALAAVPSKPMDAFFVNDYADVITPEDETYIRQLGEALEDETGAQVVAVSITWLDGMTIDDYSYELFNTWGLGDANENNGVLLLVSVGDRLVNTTVGIGLEDKLPASLTLGYTDDYAIEYLAENDFSTGIRANYQALVDKVASIYGVSLSSAQADTVPSGYTPYSDISGQDYRANDASIGFGGIMTIIIGIVVIVVIIAVIGSLLRSAGNASGCLFGWLLGRGARPRSRWGGGWGRGWGAPPPPPPRGGMGGMGPRPGAPRSRPSGGRSAGSFGGGSSFGGGGRSSSGPRSGGGGRTRGGSNPRKF